MSENSDFLRDNVCPVHSVSKDYAKKQSIIRQLVII
jgi:hypothetical protein